MRQSSIKSSPSKCTAERLSYSVCIPLSYRVCPISKYSTHGTANMSPKSLEIDKESFLFSVFEECTPVLAVAYCGFVAKDPQCMACACDCHINPPPVFDKSCIHSLFSAMCVQICDSGNVQAGMARRIKTLCLTAHQDISPCLRAHMTR